MTVQNTHQRRLPVQACEVRTALDQLATPRDRVWPADRWPALRLSDGLAVGSRGGHGDLRYTVLEAGDREVVFALTAPAELRGTMRFEIRPDGLASCVRHVLELQPTLRGRLWWAVAGVHLHNALIEDLLDNLTRVVGARVERPASWTPYVRYLRSRRVDGPRPVEPQVRVTDTRTAALA